MTYEPPLLAKPARAMLKHLVDAGPQLPRDLPGPEWARDFLLRAGLIGWTVERPLLDATALGRDALVADPEWMRTT